MQLALLLISLSALRDWLVGDLTCYLISHLGGRPRGRAHWQNISHETPMTQTLQTVKTAALSATAVCLRFILYKCMLGNASVSGKLQTYNIIIATFLLHQSHNIKDSCLNDMIVRCITVGLSLFTEISKQILQPDFNILFHKVKECTTTTISDIIINAPMLIHVRCTSSDNQLQGHWRTMYPHIIVQEGSKQYSYIQLLHPKEYREDIKSCSLFPPLLSCSFTDRDSFIQPLWVFQRFSVNFSPTDENTKSSIRLTQRIE